MTTTSSCSRERPPDGLVRPPPITQDVPEGQLLEELELVGKMPREAASTPITPLRATATRIVTVVI